MKFYLNLPQANPEHLLILEQGVESWNQWRKENPGIVPNLEGCNLRGAKLSNIDFRITNLSEADLTGADLRFANLSGIRLRDIDFSIHDPLFRMVRLTVANRTVADLSFANLSGANLSGANLIGTLLISANLTDADLSKTNLKAASFKHTVLGNIDLSTSEGLEEVFHDAPSNIDMGTIFKSKGKIPEVFLRGCGLSDLDIEYAKLAKPGLDREQITTIAYSISNLCSGRGIKFYSCFISYNSKDVAFARKIHDDLQDHGVRCWFAPKDLKIGDKIRTKIDREIRIRDRLLVVLSKNSIKSQWVGSEVEAALEEERKTDRLILLPIRLDEAVLNCREDWAALIKRTRHIGDFSNLQDEKAYQTSLNQLLRDLNS